MVRPPSLWESARQSNQTDASDQPRQRDPVDGWVNEIVESVQAALRSVGAEVASPWFYLQFGLILAAAGIAWAADAAIRSRVDMASLAMRWPMPLRYFVRMMVAQRLHRDLRHPDGGLRGWTMYHVTWPSRSYLLAVSRQTRAGVAGRSA